MSWSWTMESSSISLGLWWMPVSGSRWWNAKTSCREIVDLNPDGVFLSNGPGDPGGHLPLLLADDQRGFGQKDSADGDLPGATSFWPSPSGGRPKKWPRGHRGANHPVKDLASGRVFITSQNHGFEVVESSLPAHCQVTHLSLFDGSLEGFKLKNAPAFAVQYHPEASPRARMTPFCCLINSKTLSQI